MAAPTLPLADALRPHAKRIYDAGREAGRREAAAALNPGPAATLPAPAPAPASPPAPAARMSDAAGQNWGADADDWLPGNTHVAFGEDVQAFADRTRLVRKQITRADGVKAWYWVNPDKGGGAGAGGGSGGNAGGGGDASAPTYTRAEHESRTAAAHAAVRAAHAKPAGVTAADLASLAGHLDYLTRDQARELARELGAKLGGRKADLAARLVADVRAKKAAEEAATAPGKVRQVAPSDLAVDPKRFQFKLNTSNPAGVTDELKEVREWNPDFAGVVAVWKDPADGKTYVVNGHHRHELASRLGVKDLAVRYIDARDATEARAKGALINIAEGRGTAIDAAKFMRDTGTDIEGLKAAGVSLKSGALADQATALAGLSDKAFAALTRGDLDAGKALAVAKHLADYARQDKLFGLLAKREDEGKDIGPRTIEEMAKAMAMAPSVTRTENTLWGPEETTEDAFVQRAELAGAVRASLAQELGDYAVLASKRRAATTAGAGNVLNVEENRRIAEQAERNKNLYDQLVNRKGPISDALNAGAEKLAAAKTKKERDRARAETTESVRAAVRAEFDALDRKPGAADGGAEADPVRGGGGVDAGGGPAAGDAPRADDAGPGPAPAGGLTPGETAADPSTPADSERAATPSAPTPGWKEPDSNGSGIVTIDQEHGRFAVYRWPDGTAEVLGKSGSVTDGVKYPDTRSAMEAADRMHAERHQINGTLDTLPADELARLAPHAAANAATSPFVAGQADHTAALNAIPKGSLGYVAGHAVRRTPDGRYQVETGKAYKTVDAAGAAQHIRDSWRVAAAEARPAAKALDRAAGFREPDWFGNSEGAAEVARRKAAVPDGARAVSLEENTRGRPGTVRRDPETGAARLVLDGGETAATDFEPLESRFSWRTPEAAKPGPPAAKPGDLFAPADPR